jgi:hypothetical protein
MRSRIASDGTTNNMFGFFMDRRFSYSESWYFRRHFFYRRSMVSSDLSGYVNSPNTRTGSRKPSYCAWRDLTHDEIATGYYQQDGATCHTSNPSMQEIESFFKDRIVSKTLWPPRSPDLKPAEFFLWGLLKGKVYKNTPPTIEQLKKTLYAKRFKPSTLTLWEKYFRIWRNIFKCAWMWKETSFSIDYE